MVPREHALVRIVLSFVFFKVGPRRVKVWEYGLWKGHFLFFFYMEAAAI